MVIEDQLQVAAVRCLSILRRYHGGDRTAATKARMVAEIELLVAGLMELNVPRDVAEEGVLSPVKAYLLAFYGHEVGRNLNAEFLQVLQGIEMQSPFKNNDVQNSIERESA